MCWKCNDAYGTVRDERMSVYSDGDGMEWTGSVCCVWP